MAAKRVRIRTEAQKAARRKGTPRGRPPKARPVALAVARLAAAEGISHADAREQLGAAVGLSSIDEARLALDAGAVQPPPRVAVAPPARQEAAPAPALASPAADVAPAPGQPLAPKHLVELGARLAVAPLAQQAQLVGGLPILARLRQALAAALAPHPRAARDVSAALRAVVV